MSSKPFTLRKTSLLIKINIPATQSTRDISVGIIHFRKRSILRSKFNGVGKSLTLSSTKPRGLTTAGVTMPILLSWKCEIRLLIYNSSIEMSGFKITK